MSSRLVRLFWKWRSYRSMTSLISSGLIRVYFGAHSGLIRVNSWHIRGLSWQIRGSSGANPGPDWPRISAGVATNTHGLDPMKAECDTNRSRMRAEWFIRVYSALKVATYQKTGAESFCFPNTQECAKNRAGLAPDTAVQSRIAPNRAEFLFGAHSGVDSAIV